MWSCDGLRQTLRLGRLLVLTGSCLAIHTPGWAQSLPAAGSAPPHVSNHDRDRALHAFAEGAKAVQENHLDDATHRFAEASALDPGNKDYDAALAIARDNLATQLMQQALKARLQGDTKTFHTKMLAAAAEDGRNPLVLEHEQDLEADAPQLKPELLQNQTDDAGPVVELAAEPGAHSFHLRLGRAELLRQVLAAYGITAIVDPALKADSVPFDADNVDFAQAVQMLNLATDTFVVPLDPRRALLAEDSKENRSKYERLAIETVYLPGLTPNELSDVSNIARNVFGAALATPHESNNTLTVRAPAKAMHVFNGELQELLTGRSEVLLNVDMYEVQRERMVNEGAELPQTTNIFNVTTEVQNLINNNPTLVQEIISSGLASPGNIEEIAVALILSGQAGSSILSQPFAYFGGGITTTGLTLTSAAANMLLNNSDTRMLDRAQLRLLDQEEGSLKVGERYPIVTSSYSNLATGSTSIAGISTAGLSNTLQNLGINLSALTSAATQSVPQVQYQDIGLTLTATPRVEQGRAITLKLQFQLSSLSGQTLNSNPIINNRQTDSIITVKPGEQTVLVSQLSQQEVKTLIGIPLLSEIPGFEFGTNREVDKTVDTIVIVVTPQIIRLTHTNAEGQMVLLPAHF
jgi:general secretion pathway protein D